MTNRLAISAAQGDPFILVTGCGLWSPDDVERHFRALDKALRIMRARVGAARVLVDLSDAAVQTAEATAVMNHWTSRIYRARDQVALICGTTLLAMQIRREAKIYQRVLFRKKPEAIAWLLSDKRSGASRSA